MEAQNKTLNKLIIPKLNDTYIVSRSTLPNKGLCCQNVTASHSHSSTDCNPDWTSVGGDKDFYFFAVYSLVYSQGLEQ